MIYLKFIPLGQVYSARNIRVKSSRGEVFSLSSNEVVERKISSSEDLTFKLDYHKTNLSLRGDDKGKKFYLIYLKVRQSFPLNYIDMMFKNSLAIKEVTEAEFLEVDNSQLFLEERVSRNSPLLGHVFMLLTLVSMLQFMALLVSGNWLKDTFFWILSSFSLIGLLVMRFQKRELFYSQVYSRTFAFVSYAILFAIYLFSIVSISIWVVYLCLLLMTALKVIELRKEGVITS